MKLKDATIKALEPSDKVVKLSDGASLFLLVHPSGTKTWTYSYRFDGKQKKLTLGQYPQLSLKMAREARQAARSLLDQGIDPGAQKQASKRKDNGNTFSAIAEDWFAVYKVNRAEKTIAIYRRVLDELILPQIGNADIKDIKRLQLVELVKKDTLFEPSKAREKHHGKIAISTALKMCYCLGMIFKHAINIGRIEYSVATELSTVLPDPNYSNQSTVIKPDDVKALLQAIRMPGYANKSVWYFLNIMPYVFVRNTELRCATWDEFNLDAGEWFIPALRMKGKKQDLHNRPPHFVPLASQVVKLLRELKEDSNSNFLFPAAFHKNKCITDAAPLVALKRFEFCQTVHGFRTIASTHLHELNFPTQVIEAQMAHKDKNEVRATYNKAEYKAERIEMMQAWADYLDKLVCGPA
ncbi:integrase arm-type DNA-binding domain-containing protein [Desulfovibrio sp. OttesenSCG-928-F20]|nr:integrase arm-type DNA-binding domain-containing protein [Desulfovibrio sp. OttesenSCG-928-F20]